MISMEQTDSNCDDAHYLKPFADVIAAVTILSTHPILSTSVVRKNMNSQVNKSMFLSLMIAFSLSYVYTKNMLTSVACVVVFLVFKHWLLN